MTTKETRQLNGTIQKNPAKNGTYSVALLGLHRVQWDKTKADISETLSITIKSVGMCGVAVTIQIMETDLNTRGYQIDSKDTTITGNTTTFQWKFPIDKVKADKARSHPESPSYYLIVTEKQNNKNKSTSDTIQLTTTLKISLVNEQKKPVANEPLTIKLSNGTNVTGQTNNNGTYEKRLVPLGAHKIVFTRNPLIAPEIPLVVKTPFTASSLDLDIFKENCFFTSYIIRCGHGKEGNYRYILGASTFEIVEDILPAITSKEKGDTVSIYCADRYQLTCPAAALSKSKESVFTRYDIFCPNKVNYSSLSFIDPQFWKAINAAPTEYQINGTMSSLVVKAYNPHKYVISIKLPNPKVFQGGIKSINGKVTKFEENHTPKFIKENFEYRKSPSVKTDWKPLTNPFAIATSDKPVLFAIDRQEISTSVLEVVGSVVSLYNTVNSIVDLIKRNLPEAGAYYKFDNKFMNGKLAFAWQCKENKDHRVFKHVAVSIDVTIASLSMEIGVGIDICQVTGQIYVIFAGQIDVKASVETTTPEKDPSLSIPFGTTISGTAGARIQIGRIVKLDALITSGIRFADGALKVSTADGVSLNFGWKFTGLKAKVGVSAGAGKSGGTVMKVNKDEYEIVQKKDQNNCRADAIAYSNEYIWIKEEDWGHFTWPKKEKFPPTYLASEDLKKTIKEVFTKDNKIVIISNEGFKHNLDQIINEVVTIIDNSPNLDRSLKNIELLAYDLKKALLRNYTSTSRMTNSGIHYDTFLEILNTDFQEMLNKSISLTPIDI